MSDATAAAIKLLAIFQSYLTACSQFTKSFCKTVHIIATEGHTVGTCFGVISHAVCVVPT